MGSQPSKVRITSVEELGTVRSKNTYINRDNGFVGRIGDVVCISYGDTLWTDASYKEDVFRGMTSDSLAIATSDPLIVDDSPLLPNGYPRQFCPVMKEYGEEMATHAMGITNVVETRPGVVYFLKNHRPGGVNHIIGAGVAVVKVLKDPEGGTPTVTAHRIGNYWWDGAKEPWYGDCAVCRSGDYIYAYGHAKDLPWTYLARVHYDHATKLEAYEYWNGTDWQKERLYNMGEKESVFWQTHQGQVIWSEFYKCFVFIFCDNFWSCQVQARTAPSPTGPWSDAVVVHKPTPIQEGGNVYSPGVHEQYDPSGQTLVITYTNHPNTIQAIKVTFGPEESAENQ